MGTSDGRGFGPNDYKGGLKITSLVPTRRKNGPKTPRTAKNLLDITQIQRIVKCMEVCPHTRCGCFLQGAEDWEPWQEVEGTSHVSALTQKK